MRLLIVVATVKEAEALGCTKAHVVVSGIGRTTAAAATTAALLEQGPYDGALSVGIAGALPDAMLQAGDVFGLASILEDRPRMASCFARGPLRALRLPAGAFRELVHADGTAGSVFRVALLRALGDQVAYANAQFGQLQMARRKRSSELLARLGIEAHGRHVTREA